MKMKMVGSMPLLAVLALAAVGVLAACAGAQNPQAGGSKSPSQASAQALPKDIYPDSGNRLPAIKREDLDEEGKKVYDAFVAEPGRSGLGGGPMGVRMYNPRVAHYLHEANQYLRRQTDIPPRLVELAILVTARAWDNQYEWSAHESAGLKAGLEQEIIEVVRHRKDLKILKNVKGLGEKEAVIIQLGREVFGNRKVSSDTFARGVKLFGRQGVVNLTLLMAEYSAAAMMLTVVDQQLPPDRGALLPIP